MKRINVRGAVNVLLKSTSEAKYKSANLSNGTPPTINGEVIAGQAVDGILLQVFILLLQNPHFFNQKNKYIWLIFNNLNHLWEKHTRIKQNSLSSAILEMIPLHREEKKHQVYSWESHCCITKKSHCYALKEELILQQIQKKQKAYERY